MGEQKLSFKDMCSKFDVTPRTLRYYEYIELLEPERDGRSRFYGPREVARMKLILRGRKFGFQLEDIRQWLLIYENEGTKPASESDASFLPSSSPDKSDVDSGTYTASFCI